MKKEDKIEYKLTEKNNIKVLVAKYIKEIIDKDSEHFKISKYDLCNKILIKFSLKETTHFLNIPPFEEKEYLQFGLQKDNTSRFLELKKIKNNKTESEIIREIFSCYTTLPPFLRETNLFEEKIVYLISAKKEFKNLKFYSEKGIVEGKIERIGRNPKDNYLEIEINSEKYYVSRIEIIT